MELSQGQTFGRYSVVKIIRNLEDRHDYLVDRNDLPGSLIMSVFRLDDSQKEEALNQLHHAQQQLSQLGGSSIAQIIEIGETSEGHLFAIRQRVEGTPLQSYIEQESLHDYPSKALGLIRKIVFALNKASERGIHPTNLSTETIFITPNGEPKIIDLGYPRPKNYIGDTGVTYAAPELVAGEAPTEASTIYAIGLIMYEILAGDHPSHLGWNVSNRTSKRSMPPYLNRFRQRLSAETYQMVHACVRSQAWARFGSLPELVDYLDETVGLESKRRLAIPQLTPTDRAEQAEQAYERRRRAILLIPMLVVCALVAGSIWFFIDRDRNQNELVLVTPTGTISAVTAIDNDPLIALQTTIDTVRPLQSVSISGNVIEPFTWQWPYEITTGQEFIVTLLSLADGRTFEIGSTNSPDSSGFFQIEANLVAVPPGEYEWQVSLINLENGVVAAKSLPSLLKIRGDVDEVQTEILATETMVATEAVSAETTPTPIPLQSLTPEPTSTPPPTNTNTPEAEEEAETSASSTDEEVDEATSEPTDTADEVDPTSTPRPATAVATRVPATSTPRPFPTRTPLPTRTPWPTNTPPTIWPTHTPWPTSTPWPTKTPWPTPTNTPPTIWPTLTPVPTSTPLPPTAVPPTAVPPTSVPPTSVPPTAVPPTQTPKPQPTNTPVPPPTATPFSPPTSTPVPPDEP